MPRRLIIGTLIVLILGILGGTIVLLVQRFRAPTTTTPQTSPGVLQPAEQGNQQIADPTADDDNDGLTNAEEIAWGTSNVNPDTDGDGYKDGEEVTANHNPTIASPNDLLPSGFKPGQNLQPLTEAPLQVDQFFAENLNLVPDTANYTTEYNQRYPEDQRTQETLVAFAKQKPIITKLPIVSDTHITPAQTDSALTIGHYLDVAGDTDVLINRTVMSEVFSDLFDRNDGSSAYGLAVALRLHQEKLLATPVPPAASQLQQLLIGFSELLIATYTQMSGWNGDPVKSMVAVNQLDTIDRQYSPLIRREIERLKILQEQLDTTP